MEYTDESTMLPWPKDTDGNPIGQGDLLALPGENEARCEVDGFVILPTTPNPTTGKSKPIVRPDLWRVVD